MNALGACLPGLGLLCSAAAPGETPPHDGATYSTAYLRSEFCSSCHQFKGSGSRLNGKLIVRAALLDAASSLVPGGVEERAIGREVALDLSRETGDTRTPPDGRGALRYARRLEQRGLRLSVTVYPDSYYTGFFEALRAGGAGRGEGELREALEATRRSSFAIFAREPPLT
jgi:hypothetical protein